MQNQNKGTNYQLRQTFGEDSTNSNKESQDVISVLKFDRTGQHLALGDAGGRVIIFKNFEDLRNQKENYSYHTEFKSGQRRFDVLRGVQLDERMNGIQWLQQQGKYLKLLTTNNNSIKSWKIFQKQTITHHFLQDQKASQQASQKTSTPKTNIIVKPQHIFPIIHEANINSISSSSNQNYLLSSDQKQILYWDLENPIKPFQVSKLKETDQSNQRIQKINFSKMHPSNDCLFAYGTNHGQQKLVDMRISSNSSNNQALSFQDENSLKKKNFFSDIVSSCSSAEFVKNRYIVSRDYLTVKVWDVCNTSKTVSTTNIQQSLKGKLSDLFENDSIYDEFAISCSSDGSTALTGNYNNNFHMIDVENSTNTQYQVNYEMKTLRRQILAGKCPAISKLDCQKKTVVCDFHPQKQTFAVASSDSLHIYSI